MVSDRVNRKTKDRKVGLKDTCFYLLNLSQAKRLTPLRTGTDAIATYVGKEFGEVVGPMAAQTVRTQEEPVRTEPTAPTEDETTPGLVHMLK